MAQMTLALATARSGDPARAATLADAARAGAVAAGDDWAVAAASLIRAQTAAVAGDVDTVAAMATTVTAHSEAIGYDPFQVPGMLLHGCVAAHRNDRSAAEEAYRRTLDLSIVRASPTMRPSPWLGWARPHWRQATRTWRSSSSARRLQPQMRPGRRGWRRIAGSSSAGHSRRSGTRPRQSGCIGPSSTGRPSHVAPGARDTVLRPRGRSGDRRAPRPRRPCRRARRRGRGGRPASARRARDHLTRPTLAFRRGQRRPTAWQRHGSGTARRAPQYNEHQKKGV